MEERRAETKMRMLWLMQNFRARLSQDLRGWIWVPYLPEAIQYVVLMGVRISAVHCKGRAKQNDGRGYEV